MTHLIITRHGYSEYNKTRMYTGQVDVALTELGLRQAARTAEYVAETGIAVLIARFRSLE